MYRIRNNEVGSLESCVAMHDASHAVRRQNRRDNGGEFVVNSGGISLVPDIGLYDVLKLWSAQRPMDQMSLAAFMPDLSVT